MTALHRLLIVLFVVSTATSVAAQAQAPAPPPPEAAEAAQRENGLMDYRIGPEDVLDILVWKNPELTRTVVVRPDGRISLPLLNDILAAGLTPNELRQILSDGYAEYVNAAEVSVIVSEIRSVQVSVLGMVRNAGSYELGRQATVLDALAMAGGLTEFAKKDRIIVLRQNGRSWQRFLFDYTTASLYDASQNFTIQPRDIIVVP